MENVISIVNPDKNNKVKFKSASLNVRRQDIASNLVISYCY